MPSSAPLDWLLQRLSQLIGTATDALEQAYPDGVAAWEQEIARQLARYHAAAMLAGASSATLSDAMTTAVTRDLAIQLGFLRKFGIAIQSGAQWERGWNARAQMYAQSIKAPYWQGKVKMLPLPAIPGDGTSQCLTHCHCAWDVQQLDGDNNYDCTWVMSAVEHCQTCKQRAADWAPLRVRDGVVQI